MELRSPGGPLPEVGEQLLGEETLWWCSCLQVGAMSSPNVGFVSHLCWGGGASVRASSAALSDHNKFPLSPSWILMESRLGFSFLSQPQVLFPEKDTQWHEKGAVGRQLLFDVSSTWQGHGPHGIWVET